MAWCLIKQKADEFKKGLRDGTINPNTLTEMSGVERRDFLSKFVGEENSKQVNSLFESKLLLKNQKAGYISWAKRVLGMSPQAKRDLISRIERMDTVLDAPSEKQFLQDLAEQRLGFDITQSEAKEVSDLSKQTRELKTLANEDGTFKSEKDRLAYGASLVDLENYVNDLKLKAKKISFKQEPREYLLNAVKETPGALKSLIASLDNSLWGRQGIKTLADLRTSKIWVKNFLKSWVDIGKELRGKDAMDLIKADIYSRPNAINGKYKAGGYGLDVLTEEAYPSSLPEKIPLLRRLFRASESAYNGGALRLRADLADRFIALAEKNGVNTLNREESEPIGHLVSSLTGRGSLGKGDAVAKEINAIAFSIKFLKSNLDTLTAHRGIFGIGADKKVLKSRFAKKESAKSTLSILATMAAVLGIASLLDPEKVELDPRGPNFGKVKIFGKWVDISGGMASMLTLASRLVPTKHDGQWGFWYRNSAGNYTNMSESKYGQATPLDVLEGYLEGKLSPAAGVLRDIWKGKTFAGQPVTPQGELKQVTTPIIVQNFENLKNDPSATFLVGSVILDGLGFSIRSAPIPNIKSGLIPENKEISNENLISTVILYANALGTDPETAFNRMFTGQKIRKVTNGAIIVERMNLSESQSEKKKRGGKNPTMKLDHTIPLQLGGSNDPGNLKLVPTPQWSSYTKVENVLGKALKNKKISKQEAQKLIVDFKDGKVSATSIIKEYK